MSFDSDNRGSSASGAGLGAGVNLRYWFFEDRYRAPQSYWDLSLQYRARLFGDDRVRVIVEAFRPKAGGGFRPATADELRPQLQAYRGYRTYLFDGPHYVTPELISGLGG